MTLLQKVLKDEYDTIKEEGKNLFLFAQPISAFEKDDLYVAIALLMRERNKTEQLLNSSLEINKY